MNEVLQLDFWMTLVWADENGFPEHQKHEGFLFVESDWKLTGIDPKNVEEWLSDTYSDLIPCLHDQFDQGGQILLAWGVNAVDIYSGNIQVDSLLGYTWVSKQDAAFEDWDNYELKGEVKAQPNGKLVFEDRLFVGSLDLKAYKEFFETDLGDETHATFTNHKGQVIAEIETSKNEAGYPLYNRRLADGHFFWDGVDPKASVYDAGFGDVSYFEYEDKVVLVDDHKVLTIYVKPFFKEAIRLEHTNKKLESSDLIRGMLGKPTNVEPNKTDA